MHADSQSTSRRPGPRAANRRVGPSFTKTHLCDFALMTNLSSRVIEEESPHHPSTLGAIHHQCGDVALHVGLCRQNADTTVDVLRKPLRLHGLVIFSASDTSPDKHSEVTETAGLCKVRPVPRFKRGLLLLHPNRRVQHPAGGTQAQRQRNPRGFKGHTTEGLTKTRPRTTSIDREKGGENNQFTNPNA